MMFDRAFEIVLRHEGGYVNDPRDPGGETKYGISKRAYPKEDIANLTTARAKEIYRRDYWAKIKGDDLPWPIALAVFDSAVNCGVSRAAKWLQESIGTNADGVIGDVTVKLVKRNSNPVRIAQDVLTRRMIYYSILKHWKDYQRGWTARVLDIAANLTG